MGEDTHKLTHIIAAVHPIHITANANSTNLLKMVYLQK